MERPEAGGAVVAEDGADGVSQRPAGDGAGVGVDGWDRRFAHGRRAAALATGHDRPELLPDGVGLVEGIEASGGDLVDLGLVGGGDVQELVSPELELEAT
ncbi:MAG: hypothetical protein KF703_17945 [Actinobacteria bacterium]|nr:hypothetical protein [Actinomycetota bacterium]